MPTREIKPGMTIQFLALAAMASPSSDAYGIKNSQTGQWPRRMEVQVFAEDAQAAVNVTVEHTLDQARGWQVVQTINAFGLTQFDIVGGWYRVTNNNVVNGGRVTVLGVVA
jgi:hypothetical protein